MKIHFKVSSRFMFDQFFIFYCLEYFHIGFSWFLLITTLTLFWKAKYKPINKDQTLSI